MRDDLRAHRIDMAWSANDKNDVSENLRIITKWVAMIFVCVIVSFICLLENIGAVQCQLIMSGKLIPIVI